jgi:hypothetical protein
VDSTLQSSPFSINGLRVPWPYKYLVAELNSNFLTVFPMHWIDIQILEDAWEDEDSQMGTFRFLILLFLTVSIFRNLIFSAADDSFGDLVSSSSNGHFQIFKIQSWKIAIFRNFIFLEI